MMKKSKLSKKAKAKRAIMAKSYASKLSKKAKDLLQERMENQK